MPRNPLLSRLVDELSVAHRTLHDVVLGRWGADPVPTIALYRGFGWGNRIQVQGRVLQDEGVTPAVAGQTRWQNLGAMLRRIDAEPVPHARVLLRAGSARVELEADDEGFFHGALETRDAERVDADWVSLDAELLAPRLRAPIRSAGRALVPLAPPECIVISDVDDTVLQSRVSSLVAALRNVLFENARTRLPFPGVAAFYRALRAGARGDGRNPVFYVSSSPWNLYDVITQFLEVQEIPEGPVLLRDIDVNLDALSSSHHHVHKQARIREILGTFAKVPVLLMGDSSQQDPEIYRDVVRENPGRVRAVYIRNVTPEPQRKASIQGLAEEVLAAGSSLVLADDTVAAAEHAAEQGWISPAALPSIREERKEDQGEKPGKVSGPGAQDEGQAPEATVVVE